MLGRGRAFVRSGRPPAKWRRYFLSNAPPSIHPFFHRNIFQMYYVPRTNEVTTSAISLSLANLVKGIPLTTYPSISACVHK